MNIIKKNQDKDKNQNQNQNQEEYISSIKIIKRLVREYIKPYKKEVFAAIFFMVIVALCSAYIVKFVKPAIDDVLLAGDKKMLILLPLMMLGIYSVKGIAEYFQNYLVRFIGQKILTNLQMKMYHHLLKSDLSFIQSYSAGKLISRFTNDIIIMRGAVSNILVSCTKHFLSVVFLIILMFMIDPVLSFIVFVVFPIAAYPIQKIGRKMRNVTASTQEELSNYTSRLDETFSAIKIIKSFAAEEIETKRATKMTNNILELYRKAAVFDALTSPLMEILSGISIACILWYGGMMVINGSSTPGELFSFLTAFISAYRPFKSLVSLNVNLQEGVSATNRVFSILDKKPNIINNEVNQNYNITNNDIILQNIDLFFGKKIAINNLSLRLKANQINAIVGRSGSGKTSITNLLVRFYNTTNGNVLFNNTKIQDININFLRSQISLVTQDTILFDTSIFENIAYGNNLKISSKEEVINAAKLADAHEFIMNLPEGYDTRVGNNAITLSGGQRQKLAIARAFLKNAPILILDEATSSLDLKSEQLILDSLNKLSKKITIIIITHRLSTITNADNIFFMKHGELIEYGTHHQLIKQNGEYKKLYQHQQNKISDNSFSN